MGGCNPHDWDLGTKPAPPLEAGICESYEDLKLWRLEFATVARICCEALDQGTTVGVKLVRGGPHGRVAGVWPCAPACSSQNENPPSRDVVGKRSRF